MTDETFYRRRLPHWQPPDATIFLTWRLYGSLPREVLERLSREARLIQKEAEDSKSNWLGHEHPRFKSLEQHLDHANYGPTWLKDEKLAALVIDSLFHFAHVRYELIAFVVMANHVHILLTPLEADGVFVPIKKITQGVKGYTARVGNESLQRTGQPFWQEESYDHWARNRDEIIQIANYIEYNPVIAGLAKTPEEWHWSSAWERLNGRLKDQVL